MRWAAHASTATPLSRAAEEAIVSVQAQLGGARPTLVMAFANPGFDDAVARQLEAAFPEAALTGCSAAGVIGLDRELEGRPALSLLAAHIPEAELHMMAFGDELGHHLEARHLQASLAPGGAEPALVLALLDPRAGEPAELLGALDQAFPHAAVLGGMASGPLRGPALLVDGRASGGSGVLVAVHADLEVEPIVAQGCRPIGQPMLITRADGNLVYELGQRRPADVMRELHSSLSPGDRSLFERALFLGVEMQDKLEYAAGDFLVRNVLGVEPKSGALAIGSPVEQFKAVQFHLRDARASAEELQSLLRPSLGRAPAAGAILFSCLGRGEGLYGVPHHDTTTLRKSAGRPPVGGFFCGGEIGRVGGRTHLHGYTSSIALIRPGGGRVGSG